MVIYVFHTAETLLGLRENLKNAIEILTKSDHSLVTSISSGCELFLRFITLTALDNPVCVAVVFSENLKFLLLLFSKYYNNLCEFSSVTVPIYS